MKRFAFTGSQRVCVDGKWREPGSADFSADLHPVEEAWLVGIGAIREVPRVEAATERVTSARESK
jgi:hypothetical protein